jgi:hypothetical protein
VTLTRHGAPRASAAAGGFTLLFVADEGVQQPTEKEREGGDNEDGGKVLLKPRKHGKSLLSKGMMVFKFGFG